MNNEEALGAAWYAVYGLLPENARMGIQQRQEGNWEAWVRSPDHKASGFGYGMTPIEALQALRNKLIKESDE